MAVNKIHAILSLSLLMILSVFLAGCSSVDEPSVEVSDKVLMLDSEGTPIESADSAPEETVSAPVRTSPKDDWARVRAYVTSTYPISEEYFDAHFVFEGVESGVMLRSDNFDPYAREFPVLTEEAKLVTYHLVVNDAAGREYVVKDHLEGVYLFKGQVIDINNDDLELDPHAVPRKSYDTIGPTSEMSVLVDKQEAINTGKNIWDCTAKQFFDTWEARENLAVEFQRGKLVWNWESNGNSCLINAQKPGEVEVLVL